MDEKKKKVLFIAPHLRGGGSQRVMVNIFNNLDTKTFAPTLLLINKEGPLLNQILSKNKIKAVKAKRASLGLFEIIKEIKKGEYDLIFTMKGHIGIVVALAVLFSRTKVKVVYREVIHKTADFQNQNKSIILKKMHKWMYKRHSKVIVPSEEIKKDLVENFQVREGKIIKIWNPVDVENIKGFSKDEVSHPWFKDKLVIVGMGRLNKQKGFNILIEAFKSVNVSLEDTRLIIIGEGEEERKLKEKANKLGLKERIEFLGYKENPFKYIARAKVFVLSSIWEGFPNSLVEAMACRTPVIATECPSGPREIIEDNQNGLLVPVNDPDKMAKAILEVLNNKKLADNFREKGLEKVKKEFSQEVVLKKYEDVFRSCCKNEEI